MRLSQTFLRGGAFQALHHICGPLHDSLQHVHVSRTEMSRTGHNTPGVAHQCWIKRNDHLPRPAANTLPNAAEDIVSLVCCKGTCLFHIQPSIHEDPVSFLQSCFPAGWPSAYTGAWGCFFPGATFYTSLWSFVRFLLAQFSMLWRTLWMAP